MFCKSAVLLLACAFVFTLLGANAQPETEPKLLLFDLAKKLIKDTITLIQKVVTKSINDLNSIKNVIVTVTETAIKTATGAIDSVINGAITKIRNIAEAAIDKGIDITECYVLSLDRLHNIRIEFVANEVQCATSQLGEFNKIIDGAVQNFTDDINRVGSFPKRLQECLMTIKAIECISEVIKDVTALQQDIPKQILSTMKDIANYNIGFRERVHTCQFDVLRELKEETEKIIDHMQECI